MSENAGAAGVHAFTLERRVSRPLAREPFTHNIGKKKQQQQHSFGPFCERVCTGDCAVEPLYESVATQAASLRVKLQLGAFKKTFRRQMTDKIKGHYAFFC